MSVTVLERHHRQNITCSQMFAVFLERETHKHYCHCQHLLSAEIKVRRHLRILSFSLRSQNKLLLPAGSLKVL